MKKSINDQTLFEILFEFTSCFFFGQKGKIRAKLKKAPQNFYSRTPMIEVHIEVFL